MATVCPNCGAATAFKPKTIESDYAVLPEQSTEHRIVTGRAQVDAMVDAESPDYVGYAVCVCQNCPTAT